MSSGLKGLDLDGVLRVLGGLEHDGAEAPGLAVLALDDVSLDDITVLFRQVLQLLPFNRPGQPMHHNLQTSQMSLAQKYSGTHNTFCSNRAHARERQSG